MTKTNIRRHIKYHLRWNLNHDQVCGWFLEHTANYFIAHHEKKTTINEKLLTYMTRIFKDHVSPGTALVIYIYCYLLIVLFIVEVTQNIDLTVGHIPVTSMAIDDVRHAI